MHAALTVLLVAGCSAGPGVTGRVTEVLTDGERVELLVSFDAPHPELGESAYVYIAPGTVIEREGERVDADALQVGQAVAVELDLSGIDESLPPGVSGERIELLAP